MKLEDAIKTVDLYHDISDAVLIDAIKTLELEKLFITDKQRAYVYDSLWRIAWDSKFLVNQQDLATNPGYWADTYKSAFFNHSQSNSGALLAVNQFLARANA